MTDTKRYDVIIAGGSYSGLAAGMALGRALRKVLIIDSGKPCNRQTPHSHNFLAQDGKTPGEILEMARQQVAMYETVTFLNAEVTGGVKTGAGFEISTSSGESFTAKRLIFATGIKDIMPPLEGAAECWGISVLHCPYCHGYEVRNEKTGVLGNGEYGFEFVIHISNWTKDLTLFTNGPCTLTAEQQERLKQHGIEISEEEIAGLEHSGGYINNIVFKNHEKKALKALYVHASFRQSCSVPQSLGCELTEEGYIKVENSQKTSVAGIFACGDNASKLRTIAYAVSTGTTAGMILNKELVAEEF